LTTWDYDETGHGTSIGRITTVRYPGGSESHTYSIMGLETGVTRCVGTVCATVNQTFDVASRLRSVTYPDGELVNYGYDTAGRLYSVSGVVNAMTWSPGGQLKTATFANGTTATYNYRAGREWVDSAQLARGATVLYQMTYGHDNAARVMSTTSSTNPTSNLTFTYDGLNRLKTVTGSQTQSFVYDGVGNLTSNSALGSYAYGDSAHEHAVTTAGNLFYTYDLNGNLTREEVGSGCDRTPRRQMTWDGQNKLVGVQDGAGVTIASFDYGADGQRIMKQTVGDTTYYLGPLLEWSVGLAAFTKYYYAGPMMVARQSAGVRYFYHQDSLGSIRVITDASGNVVKSYDYTAYGGIASSSGTLSDPFQFGGHRADTESSLVYMGSRYYEPTLGRFLNPDPLVKDVERPQTLNRYAYALNSPVDHSDPTGHLPVIAAILAVIAVAAFHASWVSITFAILGAALTIAGYALHNPFLSTIGGILLGFAGGYAMVGGGGLAAFGNGILGAAVAGVTSPLSPLDPGVKMAIGWAWTAYGLLAAPTGDTSNPPIDIEAEKAAQSEIAHALATNDDALLMKGIQDAAAATGSDPAQLTAQIQDVIARASQQGKLQDLIQEVNDTPWQTDFYGSPLHVAYSNQASALAAAGPDHLQIDPVTFRLLNPTGGLTGPGSNWSGLFASPYIRGWLGLHSINHDALGFLFNYVGTGPGYTGAGPFSIELFLPGASPGNPLLGQVSGIAMQGALHAPLATIDFIR
jgi:RHS repeat-associated protein